MSMLQFIKTLGLSLCIAAFILFGSLLIMSNYRISNNELKDVISIEHQKALLSKLEFMVDKDYSSKFAFVSDFKRTFDQVNEDFRSKEEWNNIIYTNYTLLVTKQATKGIVVENKSLFLILTYVMTIIGAMMYILPKAQEAPEGIKNNHIFHRAMTNRGWLGILAGTFLILFYILLYFYPQYITEWILVMDPASKALSGNPASQWFLYGFLYTFAVSVMGIRMIIKYRHNRYQIIRTVSVIFFQTAIAFLLPEILASLNKPAVDLKNIWPLDYDFFFKYNLEALSTGGGLGLFMLFWGLALIIPGVPLMTYFFGKRWYCSWVCGCGCLAETLGDPYRQLSDKGLRSWKIERWMIHGVLVFAVIMTGATLYTYFTEKTQVLFWSSYDLQKSYGFLIGSIFSGVVGTGFYPIMGNRVWCRFGCPLAAYLGMVQRFKSRFRITTNGGQCISCGNCSTYCEMGIDVRWYAQRGQNIIRSSCVGCGICSAVCPRGVLKLENKKEEGRFGLPILIGHKNATLATDK